MKALPDTMITVISIAGLFLAWMGAAVLTSDPDILPSPVAVFSIILQEASSGELMHHMAATFARVFGAFILAMVLGTFIGLLLGNRPALNRWANPWVVFFLNMPALVVIVLCYLWIGLNEIAALVAVSVNKTAMVIVTMREGTTRQSRPLAEMAKVFQMPKWQVFRHITMPQLAPYFFTSARNGLAVIWKIVLVVEFLGRGSGVGFQIHLYFQLFEIGYVLAYSLSFVAIMFVIEYAILLPSEAKSSRWMSG